MKKLKKIGPSTVFSYAFLTVLAIVCVFAAALAAGFRI